MTQVATTGLVSEVYREQAQIAVLDRPIGQLAALLVGYMLPACALLAPGQPTD